MDAAQHDSNRPYTTCDGILSVQIPPHHHGYLDRGDEGFLIPCQFSFTHLRNTVYTSCRFLVLQESAMMRYTPRYSVAQENSSFALPCRILLDQLLQRYQAICTIKSAMISPIFVMHPKNGIPFHFSLQSFLHFALSHAQ